MSGQVHIKLLSREDTSGEGRMFRAHVSDATCGEERGLEDHMCWTTGGSVRRALLTLRGNVQQARMRKKLKP
ncbi:hypothetical protein DEO72_LG10g1859 [Vigna unguiculata]|uniref:Uncharacterized protein n=1 Tax=Vigna unguiculata TaxID=3917 RepID=A0A4D6NBD8_VIGUN|nr:hypothetical protein DEO72_LG10g1859 [Vigna unguiculata]